MPKTGWLAAALVAAAVTLPAAVSAAGKIAKVSAEPQLERIHHKPGHDGGPPGHGGKVKLEGKRHAHRGGPPPWAPAHGYRAKQGYHYHVADLPYIERLPALPLDLGVGRCNREVLGRLAGGAIGGLAGAQIGDGRGRLAAVAAGTLIGVLLGGEVGRTMDRADALCADQAFEHAPDGQAITWSSEDGRERYQIVPQDTIHGGDGRYCREYTARSTVGGRLVTTYGTACRQSDGAWKLVN